MSDLPALITSCVALLTAGGGGVKWWLGRLDQRFAAIELKLELCEEREREAQEHDLASQERRHIQLTVIELLWQELKRVAPDTQILQRAQHHLDKLKRAGAAADEMAAERALKISGSVER